MRRTLLIDAEIDCWRIALSAVGLDEAKRRLDQRLADLQRRLGAQEAIIALSDAENWRFQLLPSYKAARRGKPKPPLLGPLLAHLRAGWACRAAPGLEADDVLGVLATGAAVAGPAVEGEAVVVSADKDLRSLPGLLFDDKRGLRRISRRDAERAHLLQSLCGDAADGYRGCPGVGPKKAAALFAAYDQAPFALWPKLVALFEKAGLDEREALTQARVARILRAGEYDAARQAPVLWRPGFLRHH